jgi:hypothetical protein
MAAGCCFDGKEDCGGPATAMDAGGHATADCCDQAEGPPCVDGDDCCVSEGDDKCYGDFDSASSLGDLKLECCNFQEKRCDGRFLREALAV